MKKTYLVIFIAVAVSFIWGAEDDQSNGLPKYRLKESSAEIPDTVSVVEVEPEKPVEFYHRNMGGPRLGVSYITGNRKLQDRLKENNMDNTMSQFGWHFEYAVIPKGEGPSFVIEFIPLIGGVEYGTLIPSATLAMGVRLPSGIEFGMGPNGLYNGDEINSSLVLALGKSFNYSGVSIPINLVYATNPESDRFSIIFGYAIA
jgi:hypothetical protein